VGKSGRAARGPVVTRRDAHRTVRRSHRVARSRTRLEFTLPTVSDPSLAPEGKHVSCSPTIWRLASGSPRGGTWLLCGWLS